MPPIRVGAIEVYREPYIAGMRDKKTGEPIHAIQLDGKVYMDPEYFDKLQVEVTTRARREERE